MCAEHRSEARPWRAAALPVGAFTPIVGRAQTNPGVIGGDREQPVSVVPQIGGIGGARIDGFSECGIGIPHPYGVDRETRTVVTEVPRCSRRARRQNRNIPPLHRIGHIIRRTKNKVQSTSLRHGAHSVERRRTCQRLRRPGESHRRHACGERSRTRPVSFDIQCPHQGEAAAALINKDVMEVGGVGREGLDLSTRELNGGCPRIEGSAGAQEISI
ncbi:MAG: hypothetical protein KCHDKBKB_02021 [Elusimicrobia bacterium]|nr:hypothetical protein [Elusimicrobiota bacterium]